MFMFQKFKNKKREEEEEEPVMGEGHDLPSMRLMP